MAFVFKEKSQCSARVVSHMEPDATFGDLAAALSPSGAGGLTCEVDGVVYAGSELLRSAEIPRGALVRVVPEGAGAAPDAKTSTHPQLRSGGGLRVRVIAGLDSSSSAMLGGRVTVGRAATCDLVVDDPTVSLAHCEFSTSDHGSRARVTDMASLNGTWIEEQCCATNTPTQPGSILRIGASFLEVTDSEVPRVARLATFTTDDPSHRPGTWTWSFNRPPREQHPAPPSPIELPVANSPRVDYGRLGIAGIAVPAILGLAMAVMLHNPMWGMFALLSPILGVGTWWEQRRTGRRADNSAQRHFRAKLASFEHELRVATVTEVQRRRRASPDLETIRAVAHGPAPQLWERRVGHDDFLKLRIGFGSLGWSPPLTDAPPVSSEIEALVERTGVLRNVPIDVALGGQETVGIVGPPAVTSALARALLCRACTTHGPADLEVGVLADPAGDWAWTRWLPHVAERVGDSLIDAPWSERPKLIVVTDAALLSGHRSAARRLLRTVSHASLVVLAAHTDELPSSCTTVITATTAYGSATLHGPGVPEPVLSLALEGLSQPSASEIARSLARFSDPELGAHPAAPDRPVRLLELLELGRGDLVAELSERWATGQSRHRPSWPMGLGEEGIVDFDLVTDGPHLLVAGTTGAGKSELLRAMIVGLAATASPAELNFVLIDFKGGSAFDALAELPHTTGTVTDLSPAATARTLQCLEAELRRREHILVSAGVRDIDELSDDVPLARLVVVVDEFATLTKELPAALDALVSIAQRGRSLGLHLVLATQQPSGCVTEPIRANLNARVALRLLSEPDSRDVIDAPDAAWLARSQPGSAIVRVGADAPWRLQVAYVSQPTPAKQIEPIVVEQAWMRPEPTAAAREPQGESDLDAFVGAAIKAQARSGNEAPHVVCPPPLQDVHRLTEVALAQLDHDTIGVGIVDLPEQQRQCSFGWQVTAGPLLAVGVRGSGTTTALRTIALAAEANEQRPTQLMVLDGADAGLACLTGLGNTAAVVAVTEPERQRRFVEVLQQELERRRRAGTPGRLVVLIDDAHSFLAKWQDPSESVIGKLAEVFMQGAAHEIYCALATERISAIPVAWQAACAQRWVFRVADAAEVPPGHRDLANPDRPPGRLLAVGRGVTAHVAIGADRFESEVAELAKHVTLRADQDLQVRSLPRVVTAADCNETVGVAAGRLTVPIGLAYTSMSAAVWDLGVDEHALVIGPARSGRTSLLGAIAVQLEQASASGLPVAVVVMPGRRENELAHLAQLFVAPDELLTRGEELLSRFEHLVVVADDVDRHLDDGAALTELLARQSAGVHVIGAANSQVARTSFGRGFAALKRSRQGVALMADVDLDGELFGVRLPRRSPVRPRAGLGYVVGAGTTQLTQTMTIHPEIT